MEISRKRIRRDFAPLNVAVAIACDTAYSPLMQVYNGSNGEFEPNRMLSATIIRPIITAYASDGSWPTPQANSYLAEMVWYVNGTDISKISAWSGFYQIETVGSTRGSISILKNIMPNSEVSLHFEAKLVDSRLGVTLPIKTDAIVLSTVDKAEDTYGLTIGESKNIRYNPLQDLLDLHDYKVAHGITSSSSGAYDGNEYLRTIPVEMFEGEKKLTSGYTVKLYRVNNVNSITEVTSSDYEIVSVSPTSIVIDLRLIEKADYMIKGFVGGVEMAKCQFAIKRMRPSFKCSPTNESSILPSQVERYDQLQVESDGRNIPYPGRALKIVWFTDSATKTGVQHNEGGTTLFSLRKTGVGNDYTNDWVDVYVEASHKDAHCVATDGTDILTDESGNILIFN